MRRKREPAVIWDAGTEAVICRDERCTIIDVHFTHDIMDTKAVIRARKAIWGWVLDPLEPMRRKKRNRKSPESTCDGGVSTPALDDSILRSIRAITIKPTPIIYSDVINDFGSVADRRLYRRLSLLTKRGQIVRLAFDGTPLAGYTTPDSSLIHDPTSARNILYMQMGEIEALREAAR